MVLTFDIDTLLISIFDNIVSNQEIRHFVPCDPISPKCFSDALGEGEAIAIQFTHPITHNNNNNNNKNNNNSNNKQLNDNPGKKKWTKTAQTQSVFFPS